MGRHRALQGCSSDWDEGRDFDGATVQGATRPDEP